MFKLLNLLGFKKKIFFSLLIFASIIASFLEVLGLGLLIPIVSSLLDNSFYLKFSKIAEEYNINYFSENNLLVFCLILLPVIFFLKNIFLLFFYNLEGNFIFQTLRDFSRRIYKTFLYQKYDFYIDEDSANFFTKLSSELTILQVYLVSLSSLTSEIIVLFFLLIFLFFFVFKEAILIFLVLIIFVLIFYFFFYKKIKKLGALRKKLELERAKKIIETSKGIKEIKIYNKENIFESTYSLNTEKLSNFFKKYYIIQKLPKLFFEVIAILTISIVILFFLERGTSNEVIIKLSVITATIIRILPSINKIVHSYNSRKYSMPSIMSVINFFDRLKINKFNKKHFINDFVKEIKIKNLNFTHENSDRKNQIFKNLNFKIKKKDKISILGESGSGKSSLIDLILGFLKNDSGKIYLDNRDTKNKILTNIISYCPQFIHIFNTSIEKNISLEIENKFINFEKINKLMKICCLNSFSSSNKLKGKELGESGLKISGGQKQRIGIARALYFSREILILDESLNAVDLKTSKKILNNILKNYPHLTIILVTHSKELAKMTGKIYMIKNKKIELIND
jgi:ATP-binding cassette, subfamily B, bacterial PglK